VRAAVGVEVEVNTRSTDVHDVRQCVIELLSCACVVQSYTGGV
jgi:hypothetical protein